MQFKTRPPQNQEQPDPNPPSTTFTCEICIEPISLPSQKFKNDTNCTHPFCLDYVTKYIAVRLQDHNASIINCPTLDYDKTLDPLTCRPLIPHQLFDKWCDVQCDTSLHGLDRCYYPNRECLALVVNECGGSVKKSKCPNCKKLFCFKCKTSWHAGYRCGEMRDGNDVAFGVLVERRKWMRCQHFVELIDGCSIVKCSYKCWECCGPGTILATKYRVSFVLAFESERERNAAIMLARRSCLVGSAPGIMYFTPRDAELISENLDRMTSHSSLIEASLLREKIAESHET